MIHTGVQDQAKEICATQAFYKESFKYVLRRLSLKNSVWNSNLWINYLKRAPAFWRDASYFSLENCDMWDNVFKNALSKNCGSL